MSFLNVAANQVFCKVAVHGGGAARVVDALASLPGLHAPDDPGFRVVEFLVEGYAIGPHALRLCIFALDGSDDTYALSVGADAIAVILDGTDAPLSTIAAIAPYVNERVPVVLACPADRDPGELGLAYPAIAIDHSTVDGARALLRALLPQIVEAARAKWIK